MFQQHQDVLRKKDFFNSVGLMSGTSLDGIDVAWLRTDGNAVLEWEKGCTYPYPEQLRQNLFFLLEDREQARNAPLRELEKEIAQAQSQAVLNYIKDRNIPYEKIDIVGFHGQTIFHDPKNGITRQLGDGSLMAQILKKPVINQFRLADVEAGGEGAPLVPVFHQALTTHLEKPVVILNLGGVGNVTYSDNQTLLAFDTGPAGALIDDYMRRLFKKDYDDGGEIAKKGVVNKTFLEAFRQDPYFKKYPPKSLDRNAFHRWMDNIEALNPEDAIATLTAYTVESLLSAQKFFPQLPVTWYVSGGGRNNTYILHQLQKRLNCPVEKVETLGWDGDFLEAQAFAFLAARHIHKLPLTFPTTTGVSQPLCGGQLCYPDGESHD